MRAVTSLLLFVLMLLSGSAQAAAVTSRFHLEEATIDDVHRAIKAKELTATELVRLYLNRIAAYNGRCVNGAVDAATGLQLGEVTPIENAGQINALITLNVRGKRSKTDSSDNDPSMPDAMEAARALDTEFAKTGKLVGPLHGIPFAIKDEFDTRDMRTASGAAANYANDRPPRDAEVVTRLRAAGAIILAKSNMGEYAAGDRSTFGGTTCNPYDTTRSAGRSSGGSAAAVAANLVMCSIGEETSPSTRNPAANNSLVGFVATYSLLSHSGMMPATLTRDRPGILCRTVKDAATVLGVLAGYDPKDPDTAPSVGKLPEEPYDTFTDKPSLSGLRIGVIREFMQPFTKADEDSVRITIDAIADLKRLGAVVVDPGDHGQLFKDAMAAIVPSLESSALIATYQDVLPDKNHAADLIQLSSGKIPLPPDATFRWFYDLYGFGSPGEAEYAMDRYLAERGDKKIRDMKALIANSVYFDVIPAEGVPGSAKGRLESSFSRTETLKRADNGSSFTRELPPAALDLRETLGHRDIVRALVLKVMADNKLDALVYPTKTVPAPILAAPMEPSTLKSVSVTSKVVIDGVEYLKSSQKALDNRPAMAWTLSPVTGLPAIAVPAGFTKEVYDRTVVVGKDGSKKAGELATPKPVALPVAIDFLGREFSEPLLIRIAAAYEQGTHRRHPPKGFGPLSAEP